ncbi:Peptidase M41-like [Arabidopsis thaliana x Arabidopsis arenosa]|uniref:Peptidase M41-like n=1 Tax=Arabidopsis thaliana x Arabidopsis arenosa TaxID=1240361 RepID=A0A8T2CC93_9BRAS|nr:Peptidase M41-like [Arabidopsis thaliana x Arabidopsis arenosa]
MALSPSSPPCLRSLSPSPPPFPRRSGGFLVPRVQSVAFGIVRRHELRRPSALREWREYEDAVRRKDLAGALRFLKSIENDEERDAAESIVAAPITAKSSGLGGLELERDWQVLDACLNADDMRLVGSAFRFLKERGLLANFGKFSSIVLEGTREVTPTVLKSATGLEVTKLSPKKWGLSGGSSIALAAFLGGVSYLLSQEIDVRPNLAVILGLAYMDSVFLGGTCLAQVSCYWPPHKRRIVVHEAGHLLVAYLMGCPIRGVILDPIVAMQMGVQGQAGTQFWDQKMESEIAEGRLSGSSFDRYSMVLFAGIAAEALIYGEAEGGENDENLFRSISVLLEPPLSMAQMSNQARWSVLQSYNLLKWHKAAHRAAVEALQVGSPLSIVIRRIEEAMSSSR